MDDDSKISPASGDIEAFINEAERRFGLGEWAEGCYQHTLARESYGHGYIWGRSAGTWEATLDMAGDLAMFSAGCRHYGDERWIAVALWVMGLKGWSPQDVFEDLPMWRTADQ